MSPLNQSNLDSYAAGVDSEKPGTEHPYGAFPLHGTARLSSGRFAFPLQFSNALEWAGLFTCRYSGAASTAVTSS